MGPLSHNTAYLTTAVADSDLGCLVRLFKGALPPPSCLSLTTPTGCGVREITILHREKLGFPPKAV